MLYFQNQMSMAVSFILEQTVESERDKVKSATEMRQRDCVQVVKVSYHQSLAVCAATHAD